MSLRAVAEFSVFLFFCFFCQDAIRQTNVSTSLLNQVLLHAPEPCEGKLYACGLLQEARVRDTQAPARDVFVGLAVSRYDVSVSPGSPEVGVKCSKRLGSVKALC